MVVYRGFLFIKLAAIGSKSEKPLYFLQAEPERKEDYSLKAQRDNPWGEDKRLHKFNGKKVKIDGSEEKGTIDVKTIEECSFID
ncbi:MAG: hypothetical protein NTZ24_15240 [Deltaproteobacteria bacterium]|nr:hypothetical protein [Deltaproteobacteria bacterium]